MSAAPRFGLAFGTLVFLRALLDGGRAGPAVLVILYLFFAGVAAAAYLAVAALLRRGPVVTGTLTALAVLLLIALPFLIAAPLSMPLVARVGVRVAFAWIYVSAVHAGLSRLAGTKTLISAAIFVLTVRHLLGG